MRIRVNDLINRTIIIQIVCILFIGLLISYNPQTGALTYIPDLLNLLLIIMVLYQKKELTIKKKGFYLLPVFFLVYVSMSVFWGDMSYYDVFAQLRRYITAVLIYLISLEYLTFEHLKNGINIIICSQVMNAFITAYQNLVVKIHPDFCNGIFGFTTYSNAAQGMLSLTLSIIAIVYYIDQKWKPLKSAVAIGSSCVVCAFAEVKAYYVLLLISFLLVLFLKSEDKKTRKRIAFFCILLGMLLFVAYKILEVVMPENLNVFFSLSSYLKYEKYGAHGGAGRLSTISYIYVNVFKKDIVKTLFGLGVGSVSNAYAYTIGKIFVSFGIIGTLLLLLWYASVIWSNIRYVRISSESTIGIVLAVIMTATLFIWNGTFTQLVFLVFWVLGCVRVKEQG